ncbi:hypothetical protein [Methanosphaera sp.]
MMQCMLCGCKFDETKVEPCGCNCAFGGCNGENVRCPNCGHDMPIPRELKKNLTEDQQKSLLTRIINSLKSEN